MALIYIVVFTLIIALASTGTNSDSECKTPICEKIAEDMLRFVNQEADPCTDFYNVACDTYVKDAVIPDDKLEVGVFYEVNKKLNEDLKAILEITPENNNAHTYKNIVHNFYKSCMDEETIEKKGTGPILNLLKIKYGGWPIIEDNWTENSVRLTSILTELFMNKQMSLLNIGIFPDDKNTSSHIIALYQKDVRFPKDYYTNAEHKKMIEALRKFMQDTAKYLSPSTDENQINKDVEAMIEFEKQLAKINVLPEDTRGELQTKMKLDDLIQIAKKETNLHNFFKSIFQSVNYTIGLDEPVALYETEYILKLGEILVAVEKRIIINYILFDLIYNLGITLPKEFQNISAEFESVVHGTSKTEPRWERCIGQVNTLLDQPLGALYAKRFFNKTAKAKILELIKDIKNSFETIISQVTWMSNDTKKLAIEKESKIRDHVAYPDHFDKKKPFSNAFQKVNIKPDAFQDNIIVLSKLNVLKHLKKLREPVDPDKFDLKVAEVNSYYATWTNSIILPAAVLQMPFFSESSPMYFNFGGIGVIIGHEITHGFDDEGRKYDKDGMTNEWWKKEDIDKFKDATKCLVTQYSNFVDPTINASINGQLTLGENIADNGGVRAAYMAYQNWIKQNGTELKLPGLKYTPEQLFFINFARVFCNKARPEYATIENNNGIHTPGQFRVMGALMNLKEFAEAFNCTKNSVMNPENRCSVW